jgi:diguanylate cyclase (GGDEF)-like protein
MVNIAKEKGEGFISYWWKKNKEDDTPYQKLSFVKNLPLLHAVIGTGVYIDDIEKELKKRKKELLQQLRHIIKYTKIGKTGYVYIFDDNANMLIHPNDNINGKNFANTKNPTKNSNIFDDLINASKKTKILYYKWDKPSDKGNYIYNKVSWIEYIPDLKWYVVSSAYVDDFQKAASEMRNFILLIAFVIVMISILLSLIFFRHLLKPISNLANLTREVKNGNYSIRSDYKSDDEIGMLSDAFNNMLDTIKNNIDTLDMKVRQRTKDLQRTQEELKKLAITDPMTKLYNRRYYTNVSLELLALAKRDGQGIGVIMIDIDKFKNINDTYGHSVGDEVIIALAEVLLENARDGDIAFRFGGEEFVMLLPNTDIEGTKTLAEKIRKILEKLNIASGDDKVLNFTVSMGVSSVAVSSERNTEKAIKRADKALYEAKQNGRNKVCLTPV